jgi:hypothetical protein
MVEESDERSLQGEANPMSTAFHGPPQTSPSKLERERPLAARSRAGRVLHANHAQCRAAIAEMAHETVLAQGQTAHKVGHGNAGMQGERPSARRYWDERHKGADQGGGSPAKWTHFDASHHLRPATAVLPLQSLRPASVAAPYSPATPRASTPSRNLPNRPGCTPRSNTGTTSRRTSPRPGALPRAPSAPPMSRTVIFRRARVSSGTPAPRDLPPLPSEVYFYLRTRSTASKYPFPPSIDEQRYLHVARLDPYDPNAIEPRAVVGLAPDSIVGMSRGEPIHSVASLVLCVPCEWSQQRGRMLNPDVEPTEVLMPIAGSHESPRVVVPISMMPPSSDYMPH